MDYLGLVQWPAMLVSIIAAWLVGEQSKRGRSRGFWWFLLSNVLWIVWGWHTHAWALIALQVALAGLNIRGAQKNEKALSQETSGHSTNRNLEEREEGP